MRLSKKTSFFLGFFMFLGFALATPLTAQQESAKVRSGNKYYAKEKYTESEIEYRKALEKNHKSFEGQFNLGDALFRQGKYEEAIGHFKVAETLLKEDKEKSAAVQHNIGNALFAQQKYAESIEAYKKALKQNPKDDETRYNLAYAQQMRKQQQENEQNKNEDKQDKKEDEQQQQQQEQQQDQNRQPEQQQEPNMSKESAEQLLEALLQDEKETQEKAKRAQIPRGKNAEKDW